MAVERPIVLIDMDGVLADFDGALERAVKEVHPEFVAPDRAIDFYLSKRVDDPLVLNHSDTIKNAQGFFRNLPTIDGAIEAWQHMEELGYHPRICTAPLVTNLYCKAEKLDWLEEHLGVRVRNDAIVDGDKWRHHGITLIDDRPVVDGYDKASWVHTVFTQPYNKTIETEFRLDSWEDQNLESLLARCAKRALSLSI